MADHTSQIPTFAYYVSQLAEKHPDLAYISLVEPGLSAGEDKDIEEGEVSLADPAHMMRFSES